MTKKELKALHKMLVKFQDFLTPEPETCVCNCGNEHETEDISTDETEEVQNTINLVENNIIVANFIDKHAKR